MGQVCSYANSYLFIGGKASVFVFIIIIILFQIRDDTTFTIF